MESLPLNLSDPEMLAEFVPQSQLKTFFEKRFASPEDLGAILFRDGAVINHYTGTQFSIGGLWENMKGVLGGSHHYAIMLADLKPFNAIIPIKAISKDNVEIVGEATFELQLNPEKITNILGLMRGVSRNESDPDKKTGEGGALGRQALQVMDVVNRLEPHFRERIFGVVIGRHNADELRGSTGMQDQMQKDMMLEAERILGDVGVMVRASTVNFAMNERERQEYERARISRDEEMKDYALEILKKQVSREADSTSFMLNTQRDQATLQRINADELRTMILNSEASFVDAREIHKRRQEFSALQHEAKMLLEENGAKTTIALAEIEDGVAKSKATLNLRKVEFDLTAFENEFRREQTSVEKRWTRDEEEQQKEHERRQAIEDAKGKLGTTKIDLETQDLTHEQKMKEARDAQELALGNLAAMNDIEVKKASGLSDIEIAKQRAESSAKVDQMLAAGSLSPEQLAQVMPGLSEDAAKVAIARAQSEGQNAEQMIALAREMTAESRDQEHRMFGTGMQGGVGMAAGLGGADVGDAGGGAGATGTVECPNCKVLNPVRAKYCKACSKQMRT